MTGNAARQTARRAASAAGRALLLAVAIGLVGCEGIETERVDRDPVAGPGKAYRRTVGGTADPGSIFGPGGLDLFGGNGAKDGEASGGIGVNSFLWRASLDTLSFMPLASADPFGGVIITDWYSPPETPDERLKLTVYILDRQLRSDGLKVAVFRQQRPESGADGWVDVAVAPETATELENAILTRARQLRINTLGE